MVIDLFMDTWTIVLVIWTSFLSLIMFELWQRTRKLEQESKWRKKGDTSTYGGIANVQEEPGQGRDRPDSGEGVHRPKTKRAKRKGNAQPDEERYGDL